VVVIGIKQPEKEIEKGKVICIKMVGKEIDKPGQVDESQMSLVIVMAMSGVGKEWEDVVDRNLVVVKTIRGRENQQQKRYNQQWEENMKMKKQIKELKKEIED
jgi:hypothetical protein